MMNEMWTLYGTTYAPLSGLWRIYLYGGLLVLCLLSYLHSRPYGDSPLNAPEVVERTASAFFKPPGLLVFFGRWIYSPRILRTVRNIVVIAWISCMIGFGGQWSSFVAGFGVLFLHGVLSGVLGTNHRWMLPVYVLCAAAFVNWNDSYSVDAWIAYYEPNYFFSPHETTTVSTGLLRFLTLLFVVFTLFAGGIAKLRYSGIRWMDGESLRFFISRPRVGSWKWLKTWFTKHPSSCSAISIATMVIELGAPVALVYEQARMPLIIATLLFHLGIWLTMNPNYLPQSWCYALCLDWTWFHADPAVQLSQTPTSISLIALSLLAFILLVVTFRGVEWWPLTCIPMYGFYRGPYSQWSFDYIADQRQMEKLGQEFVKSRLPYPLSWSEGWVAVRIRSSHGITRELRPNDVLKKHWNRLLHRAAALEFAENTGHSSSTSSHARDFLESHISAFQGYLEPSEMATDECAIELVGLFRDGEKVLASIKANESVRLQQQKNHMKGVSMHV